MYNLWTKQAGLLAAIFMVVILVIAATPHQARAENDDDDHNRRNYHGEKSNSGRHLGWYKKNKNVDQGYYPPREYYPPQAYYPPPVYYPPTPPAAVVAPPYPNFNIVVPLWR